MTTTDRATVLVCATLDDRPEPEVVLADGSYETERERVFWRSTPDLEVLRIPLQAQVSVRQVRPLPRQRRSEDGEQRLLAAVAANRTSAGPRLIASRTPDEQDVLRLRLAVLLQEGETQEAETAARELWQRAGLPDVHDTIAQCLAATGAVWAAGRGSVLAERRAATAARTVLERLRPLDSAGGRGLVVLAVPAGDGHTLALTALEHQLQDAGYTCLVVDDLPEDELCTLATEPETVAVVLSVHRRVTVAVLRRCLTAVRAAAPEALLAVGGPGVPSMLRGADLITSDAAELVRALASRTDPLTEREREVLVAVAEGLTNNEIADALRVSPATVKTHLDHVFAKTGTEHRASAVARALRQGWIS